MTKLEGIATTHEGYISDVIVKRLQEAFKKIDKRRVYVFKDWDREFLKQIEQKTNLLKNRNKT